MCQLRRIVVLQEKVQFLHRPWDKALLNNLEDRARISGIAEHCEDRGR